MRFGNGERRFLVEIFGFKNAEYVLGRELLVQTVADALDGVAQRLAHFGRQIVAVVLL